MNPKIDVITIGVTDLDRAVRFYEEGFGLAVEQRSANSARLGLGAGSSTLELRGWEALADEAGVPAEGTGFRGFTLSYIVEQASDVDDMLARLERAGGVVAKAPRFAFWGYSAHVADPSGHLWKIASPKRRPLLGRKKTKDGVREPVPAQEIALTIGVADMKRAKEFYKDGLGCPVKKDYSKFVMFGNGGGTADLAMYKWDALADDADVAPEGTGFRGFTVAHVVDSAGELDAVLDRANGAGGRVLRRSLDGGHSAYFTDPDGYLWKVASRA